MQSFIYPLKASENRKVYWERKGERDRQTDRQTDRQKEGGRETWADETTKTNSLF